MTTLDPADALRLLRARHDLQAKVTGAMLDAKRLEPTLDVIAALENVILCIDGEVPIRKRVLELEDWAGTFGIKVEAELRRAVGDLEARLAELHAMLEQIAVPPARSLIEEIRAESQDVGEFSSFVEMARSLEAPLVTDAFKAAIAPTPGAFSAKVDPEAIVGPGPVGTMQARPTPPSVTDDDEHPELPTRAPAPKQKGGNWDPAHPWRKTGTKMATRGSATSHLDLGPKVVAPPGRASTMITSLRTSSPSEDKPVVEVGPIERRNMPKGGRRLQILEMLKRGPMTSSAIAEAVGETDAAGKHRIEVTCSAMARDGVVLAAKAKGSSGKVYSLP